jgi:hypothetical protein
MPAALLSGAQAPVAVDASQMASHAISTSWLRLFVVPVAIGLTQAAWWWEVVTSWGQRSPLGVIALVPVLALLVGWQSLRRDPPGRQIHDRQLDMILCFLLTVMAVAMLLLARGDRSLEAASASCLTAAAIVVAGWGSRTLWQLRWPILLLLLTWVEPWAQLSHLLSPLGARFAVGDRADRVPCLGRRDDGGGPMAACIIEHLRLVAGSDNGRWCPTDGLHRPVLRGRLGLLRRRQDEAFRRRRVGLCVGIGRCRDRVAGMRRVGKSRLASAG